MTTLLVTPTYLGSVYQYALFYRSKRIVMEQHSFYEKKTFRNRTLIMAANGPLTLSVPVEKPAKIKTCEKDILLSYDTPWQANHWRSIVSAYQSSPFFEYYADEFEPFYSKRFKFLIDFNLQLMQTVCENIGLACELFLSDNYIGQTTDMLDLRQLASTKFSYDIATPNYTVHPYWQVFKEKYGFVPHLSIVDLLFCMGPESIEVLRKSFNEN